MKRQSFLFLLVQAILLPLLAGCNLYMDGDGMSADDTENGDGFSAPKTIEDSLTTVTYQFSEGTKMLDERYRQYITRYRGDSLNNLAEIYLRRSIPANMLPQRGNYLSTDLFDIFDMGLVHQVDVVVADGDQIVVKAHRVTMGEVFKKLKISSDFYVAMDSSEIAAAVEATRAGGSRELGYKLRPVRNRGANLTRSSAFEKDFDCTFFSYEFAFIPFSYSFTDHLDNLSPKTQGIMRKLSNAKNKIDRSYVKPFGSIDAGLGASISLGLRVQVKYDEEEKEIDVHGYTYREIQCGLNVKEAKGGVCIPLAGWGRKEIKRANRSVGSSTTEVDDYLVKVKTQDIPIPAGPIKMTASIQPNLVLDLFASYQFNPDAGGLLFGGSSEGIISEFGFHDDPVNGSYAYPRDKGVTKEVQKGEDEWNTSFAAGVELHAYLDFILKIFEAVQCKITPEMSITAGYEKNLTDKFRLDDFVMESGATHTPAYGCNSDMYVQLAAGVTLSGVIELGPFWSIDLFGIDVVKSSHTWKWAFYPDFNTVLENDKEKSTQETSVFNAEVKVSHDYLYAPREAPLLAIYCAPSSNTDGQKKFVKLVRPSGESYLFTDKTTYRYSFSIPGRDTQHTYFAVPVFLTGYGITRQYMYGTPTPFFSAYVSLAISGMKQLKVRNAVQDASNLYAFTFRLGGVAPAGAKKNMVQIDIYSSRFGAPVASRKFSLGQLPKGRFTRDYVFYFTGSRPSYYVTATYYVEDGGGYNDTSRDELTVSAGGGDEEIDDLRYGVCDKSDYYLLQ